MWIKKILCRRKQILCVAAGLTAGIAAQAAQNAGSRLTDLKRPAFGSQEQQQLLVKGLRPEEVPVEIQVSPRQYTEEEAREIYDQIFDEIPERILGENSSLAQVEHDLNLIKEIPEYGVSLEWESSNPEFLDSGGKVNRQNLSGEEQMVWLSMHITDGHTGETYQFQVWLQPEIRTAQEEELLSFQKQLEEEDYEQRHSPVLELPEEFAGKSLSYRKQQQSVLASMTFLGASGAMLLTVKERSDRQREIKERKKQLLMDYPELLSKMMIFLGAGMTVRNAWEQMTNDYLQMRRLGRREKRWVYEEMYEACGQMKRGIPEGQAYLEFGKRCNLPCYTKFAGFLEQSRKNGVKNLREHLKLEMAEAYDQRRHQAKRLGEEASTKLLLPLFLMLGVVMVMVAVPALLEFL